MIHALLGKQLRQLYTARLAFESHKSSQYLVSLWNMKSSYPAEKLMQAASRFNRTWCRWAVSRAAEVDLALKSSGGDAAELLPAFLLELAHG